MTSLSLRRGLPGGEPRGHCFSWSWSWPVKTQGAALALRLLLLHPQGFWKGLHTEVPLQEAVEILLHPQLLVPEWGREAQWPVLCLIAGSAQIRVHVQ